MASPYGTPYDTYMYDAAPEEADEPVNRFWLSNVACIGPERRLIDCDLGPKFSDTNAGCSRRTHRIHIACMQFPVVEAVEEVTTPDAPVLPLRPHPTMQQAVSAFHCRASVECNHTSGSPSCTF